MAWLIGVCAKAMSRMVSAAATIRIMSNLACLLKIELRGRAGGSHLMSSSFPKSDCAQARLR
jgi:hypothetical protein